MLASFVETAPFSRCFILSVTTTQNKYVRPYILWSAIMIWLFGLRANICIIAMVQRVSMVAEVYLILKAIRRWFRERGGRIGGLRSELQNLFQGQWEMEFGILGSDDGLPGFSGLERNLGLWMRDRESVHWQMDSSIINGMVKIAKKYIKFQSVEGIGTH